jgi:L-alanine-DL-glutamate epimerase-like enolase superfamily enzyme
MELLGNDGTVGLRFVNTFMGSLPDEAEMARVFTLEAWAELEGQIPAVLADRQLKRRGSNRRKLSLPFDDAIQKAVWDASAKSMGPPLWKLLGGTKERVRVYASGLHFRLSDADYFWVEDSIPRDDIAGLRLLRGGSGIMRLGWYAKGTSSWRSATASSSSA